ncbi:MAG: hypothetical protein SD837_08565 [Candidatus Electrothrix scaldis]|nr:MAG: hypothetical protein SD837_08565 [Candidatus Electrothrix sp. GW3-3]
MMIDEILQELRAVKDKIAKEYSYSLDDLAEYYSQKQMNNPEKFYQGKKNIKTEQVARSE